MARIAAVVALAASLTGCERIIVEGRATNSRGEALPGVVVRLSGTEQQDLTDGLGRYRLTASRRSSNIRLEFSKTGYGRAEQTTAVSGRLRLRVPDAALWLLPANPGTYTLERNQYIASDWFLPKQYYLKDGSVVYGVELPEELRAKAEATDPFIVCFRTPRYNARLARLAQAEAIIPGLESGAIQIWIELSSIDAQLKPVDPTDGNLQRVVVDRTLQPGVYAIHWGAMEGYTTLESRVFVFRLQEPPAEVEVIEEGAGETPDGDAAAGDSAEGGQTTDPPAKQPTSKPQR